MIGHTLNWLRTHSILTGLLVVGVLVPLGATLGRIPLTETILGLGGGPPANSSVDSVVEEVPPVQVPRPQPTWHLTTYGENKAKLIESPDHQQMKRIEVSRADTNAGWHIQLTQKPLSVREQEWYSLRFRARADDLRKMGVALGQAHDPWENLGLYRSVAVMKQWEDFEWEFFATADDDVAQIHFDLGGWNVPVDIAEVRFLRLSHNVLNWRLNFRGGNEAGLEEVPAFPLGIRVNITKAQSKKPNHIQLVQKGVKLQAHESYRLRFDARADRPRDMSFGVSQADYPWEDLGLNQTVSLSKDWQQFDLEFTANGTDDHARVYFDLGQQSIPVEINAALVQKIVESVRPPANSSTPPLSKAPSTVGAVGPT